LADHQNRPPSRAPLLDYVREIFTDLSSFTVIGIFQTTSASSVGLLVSMALACMVIGQQRP
jgi:acetyl-CoA carboxylase alpha subunit